MDDASSWPAWQSQLVSFLEHHTTEHKVFWNFDIAAIIDKAKQEYIDRYGNTMTLLASASAITEARSCWAHPKVLRN